MTDAALPASRSLFQLAVLRMRRNRAAMASLLLFGLIALFCIAGPLAAPHGYAQIFQAYVAVPPSLTPYPKGEMLRAMMSTAAAQAHVDLTAFETSGEGFTATVSAAKVIDPRVVRYIDRAAAFTGTTVAATRDDGRTLDLSGRLRGERFFFGTDNNGRDLMARVMVGGQISLLVGFLASLVSLVIGVVYGATSGFIGGRTDNVMMRFIEILYSLPFVFLVIMLVVFFGRNFVLIFAAIGAIEWLEMARIVRGQALSLKRREFVVAAHAMGLDDWAVIRRHIIPNTIGQVVVFITVRVPRVMLLESFLSYLGLGVAEPLTSWGVLIAEGTNVMQSAPWQLIFPAAFFVTTLLCLNFIGDGLRDAFDPRNH